MSFAARRRPGNRTGQRPPAAQCRRRQADNSPIRHLARLEGLAEPGEADIRAEKANIALEGRFPGRGNAGGRLKSL